MLADLAWRLGVGVALGWAALPLLVKLAQRNRRAAPAGYYRALVAALGIATGLVFAPAVRGWTGLDIELPLSMPVSEWPGSRSITFVADWVTPLLGSRARPWSSLSLSSLLAGIGLGWLLAMGAGIAHSVWCRVELWQAYRCAAAAPARVLARAAHVAAELGIVVPEIRFAEGLSSAFTFGFFSPVVVVGSTACGECEDELDFILRHELLHVLRADTRAAFWIDLAQRCFTGHPCLRGLAAEIRFAREATVDAAAAGAVPFEYARFLLVLAERMRSSSMPGAHLISMADTTLERRVEMLITSTRKPARLWRSASLVGLCGLALGALIFLAPSSWGQGDDAGANDSDHPRVAGNLSVEQVEKAVFAHPRPFVDCLAQLPEPRPSVGARMVFEIAEDGRVSRAHADVSEFTELGPCLEGALKGVVFPAPSSGTVTVDFPIKLTPPPEELQARAEADKHSARLSPEVIQKGVKAGYPLFKACYEAFPEPRPKLNARMDFTIGRDGTVTVGTVEVKDQPQFATCLHGVMRSLVFPAPKDGIVTVVYPISFAP